MTVSRENSISECTDRPLGRVELAGAGSPRTETALRFRAREAAASKLLNGAAYSQLGLSRLRYNVRNT